MPSYAKPTLSSMRSVSQPHSSSIEKASLPRADSKRASALRPAPQPSGLRPSAPNASTARKQADATIKTAAPSKPVKLPSSKGKIEGKAKPTPAVCANSPLGQLLASPAYEDILKVILEMVDRKDLNACLRVSGRFTRWERSGMRAHLRQLCRQTNAAFLEYSSLQIRLRRLLYNLPSPHASQSDLRPRDELKRLVHRQCRREQYSLCTNATLSSSLDLVDAQDGVILERHSDPHLQPPIWVLRSGDGLRRAVVPPPAGISDTLAMCVADKVIFRASLSSTAIVTLKPWLLRLQHHERVFNTLVHPLSPVDLLQCALPTPPGPYSDITIQIGSDGLIMVLVSEGYKRDRNSIVIASRRQHLVVWNWMQGICLAVRGFFTHLWGTPDTISAGPHFPPSRNTRHIMPFSVQESHHVRHSVPWTTRAALDDRLYIPLRSKSSNSIVTIICCWCPFRRMLEANATDLFRIIKSNDCVLWAGCCSRHSSPLGEAAGRPALRSKWPQKWRAAVQSRSPGYLAQAPKDSMVLQYSKTSFRSCLDRLQKERSPRTRTILSNGVTGDTSCDSNHRRAYTRQCLSGRRQRRSMSIESSSPNSISV